MQRATMEFTAVYRKAARGYIGFVEKLPGVNAEGRTIEETRCNLMHLAGIAFDEEQRQAVERLVGRNVVRESFRLAVRSAGAQPRFARAE